MEGVQDSTPWSSFTSNNRRTKLGDIGPSDREGLRGRKWCTCSDVASWGSRAKAVSNEDIYLKVVGMWIGGRQEAGSAYRQQRRDRRTSRAGARPKITVRPAVGLLPRCRRRPKRCPSSPSSAEGDTSGSVTSGEDRKTVFFEGRKTVLLPLSCLDLESMRVCE